MLTIAGSGINDYSLKEVVHKLSIEKFDCLIADKNFDKEKNRALLPEKPEPKFLSYKEIKPALKEAIIEQKKVLYVVTGSPVFYSATSDVKKFLKTELPEFDQKNIEIITAESSKDYLLRKLQIPENEVTSFSIHGRSGLDLTRFLSTKYTFLLCDKNSIELLKENTAYLKDDLIFYTGSKLGSKDEKIDKIDIFSINLTPEEISTKYCPFVILIEKNFEAEAKISKTEEFETNAGMITKTDKRIFSLEALELAPNLLMWDIGAGSGSVSIDAYKIFKIKTILFEKNESQCDFIEKNLKTHKVPATKLIRGNFLDNFDDLPGPDRIFIGGGGEQVLQKLPDLYNELKQGGILVANVIGLENFTEAIQALKNSDTEYQVRTLDISYYKPINEKIKLSIPEPERTLFQIILKKQQ